VIKTKIKKVVGREVLDSRGNPTVEATVYTAKGKSRAIVPSGASTGIYECLELRDKTKRYLGKGVLKAVRNIEKINRRIKGMSLSNQSAVDEVMLKLDGTKKKTKLGANAILAVSLAVSREAARSQGIPLHTHISRQNRTKQTIPVPFCNIINGGKHAGNKLEMQEFMIAPVKAKSFSDATRSVAETYHTLRGILQRKYGKNAVNVGDEGGFAPPIAKPEQALRLIEKSIEKAGAKGMKIAMDPAASEFYNGKNYVLNKKYSYHDLAEYYTRLSDDYEIVSIEDPFDQNDFKAFQSFKPKSVQVVGDDLLVTSVERIRIAAKERLCNALLLKVNQIGSLTESIQAYRLATKNKWNTMVSHRSGETEDTYISDLATGLGTGQIKLGAPARGERTAKYNQLLRIEEEMGKRARYARW